MEDILHVTEVRSQPEAKTTHAEHQPQCCKDGGDNPTGSTNHHAAETVREAPHGNQKQASLVDTGLKANGMALQTLLK